MDSLTRQEIIDFIQSQKDSENNHVYQPKFDLKYQKGDKKEYYNYPVLTKWCNHEKTQELDQILQTKCCAWCKNTINSYKDLIMDIRWEARLIMHKETEYITIIKGQIFHSYNRSKQYYEIFTEQKYGQLVADLFENYNQKNDFREFAKIDSLYKKEKVDDQLHYDAICQLDFVKIQIPVRHKDCKHVGCYELTSILAYKKEILASKPDTKFIQCFGKCQVKIDLNRLEQDLVLDKQLLDAIRKSRPHSIKFYIKPNYDLDDKNSQNTDSDPYIQEYYKQKKSIIFKQELYKKFENEVFNILQDIYQRKLSDLSKGEGKKVFAQSKLYEFQDQTLDLQDPFLKSQLIEYPVRCIQCSFDKCSDIRTYIGDFLQARQKTPKEQFKCPLCSNTCNKLYEQIRNLNLQDYIYLDQNLLKRLLERRESVHERIFVYHGRRYMLDEFQRRHKIFAADVKAQCQDSNMEFLNLNCIVSGTRLKNPLKIFKCQSNNYVDFDSFYNELEKRGYDFGGGMALCKCQTCQGEPIMSIGDIYFDEFFSIALKKQQDYESINKIILNKLLINVSTEELIVQYADEQAQNKSIIRPQSVLPRLGFDDLWTEEERQNFNQFFEKKLQYGGAQINKVTQNLLGMQFEITKDHVSSNIDQRKQQLNEIAQNDIYKQLKIAVIDIQVTLKNDDTKLNQEIQFQTKQK